MSNIETFKSSFQDLARPNRFRITGGWGGNAIPKEGIMCTTAQIMGKSLATMEYRMPHQVWKLPYDMVYPDITLTFLAGEDFAEWNYFQQWFGAIWGTYTNDDGIFQNIPAFSYFDDYKGNLTIDQLSRENEGEGQDSSPKVLYTQKLIDCHPITISNLELGMDKNNAFNTFSVTMAYLRSEDENYTEEGMDEA